MENHIINKGGLAESGQIVFRSLFCIYKKENDTGIWGCYNKLK